MAPGVYETSAASIARMRGGHFMVVCCRDVSRPGCATAPVAGTFPGRYCLRTVAHYWAIVMGTGSALGMTRAQTHTSEARSFRRNCNA
jgi:hypothetical protein